MEEKRMIQRSLVWWVGAGVLMVTGFVFMGLMKKILRFSQIYSDVLGITRAAARGQVQATGGLAGRRRFHGGAGFVLWRGSGLWLD